MDPTKPCMEMAAYPARARPRPEGLANGTTTTVVDRKKARLRQASNRALPGAM